MVRRTIITILITAVMATAVFADVRFSIRYHDKNIYYPGDEIVLKLTLENAAGPGQEDFTFFLADDPRKSFGFDLRTLTGKPALLAEGFAAALDDGGAYRVVHLAPGQEMTISASLGDWVQISEPGQYRLRAFFFPKLRGGTKNAVGAESVLDLTVMPQTANRWQDALDRDVRQALIERNLDPFNVVLETLESRRDNRNNRVLLYLDSESLSRILPNFSDEEELENAVLQGAWNRVPGFEHPFKDYQLVSSQMTGDEAVVQLKVQYGPYGERFERDLRFYLHKKDQFWSIRRVQSLDENDVNPVYYGQTDLAPQEIVEELLRAVKRGDWDIALRYLDPLEIVKGLPEYVDRWMDMSASEHERAVDLYRSKLISGTMTGEQLPLMDIDEWSIRDVSYGQREGTVNVVNTKTFPAASGPYTQRSVYSFRLEKINGSKDRWQVVDYSVSILRSDS